MFGAQPYFGRTLLLPRSVIIEEYPSNVRLMYA